MMTEPIDLAVIRALLIPATRTVFKTADVRGKSDARAAILRMLPWLIEEVEQLRVANRLQSRATDIWVQRTAKAECELAEARKALEAQP